MMAFIQTTKRNLAAFSLAILLSMQTVSAMSYLPSCNTVKNGAKTALFCAIFLSAYDCYTRKATNDPVAYNIDELLALNNVTENLKNLWRDGVWGHTGKNNSVKVDEDGNLIVETEKVSPKGLVGTMLHNWKAIAGALGTAWLVKTMIEVMTESSNVPVLDRLAKIVTDKANALGLKLIPQAANTVADLAK